MKLVDRFRYWVAEPLLEKLRGEHASEVVVRQTEAYQLGYSQGSAHGEFRGQQMLICELTRIMDERKSVTMEVTEADIERAKKGILH